ncbi:MAG: polyketide synthase dehydratase domain-containing protein, partial [Rhodospirillaceae bacterium]|nr:polyketide synthase dehydratase domain-containing protein [Rhodospirillaceae bacterium]
KAAAALAAALDGKPGRVEDIGNTLALRRTHLPRRLAVLADSVADLRRNLSAFAEGRAAAATVTREMGDIVEGTPVASAGTLFVFAGQGGQYAGMAQGLLADDALARSVIEQFSKCYRDLSGIDIIEEIGTAARIAATIISQPAIFALQAALLARWREWGVVPDAVMGHSFGEMGAAHAAGILSLEACARAIFHRATLSSRTAGRGAIYAVGISAAEMRHKLACYGAFDLDIAAFNGPNLVNLAGPTASLERVVERLKADEPELYLRRIHMDYAPHCRLLDSIKSEFESAIADVEHEPARIPFISTVSARRISATGVDPSYWWENLRRPVRFTEALQTALTLGYRRFVEIGPHNNMCAMIHGIAGERGDAVAAIPSLIRGSDDRRTLRQAAAKLHVSGAKLDWEKVNGRGYEFVQLPGNSWRPRRFYPDSPQIREDLFTVPAHPLLGRRLGSSTPAWRSEISAKWPSYLTDHRIDGNIVFPGAGYVEIFLAAGRELFGPKSFELEDVSFVEALSLPPEQVELMETTYDQERGRLRIQSRNSASGGEWTLRATARIRARDLPMPLAAKMMKRPRLTAPGTVLYQIAERSALQYGPAFRPVRSIALGEDHIEADLSITKPIKSGLREYLLHPALLDGCFQLFFAPGADPALARQWSNGGTYLPIGLGRVRFYGKPTAKFRARVSNFVADGQRISFNIDIVGSDGKLCAAIEGFTSRRVEVRDTRANASGARQGFYRESWREAPLPKPPGAAKGEGSWIVFANGDAASESLMKGLRRQGFKCIEVRKTSAENAANRNFISIDPTQQSEYAQLLATATNSGKPVAGIVHLWPLVTRSGHGAMEQQDSGAASALPLLKALLEREDWQGRLWFATSGAQILAGDKPSTLPVHSPLVGLARTALSEVPALRCTTVDLDDIGEAGMRRLLHELRANSPETEVAYRGSRRLAAVIEPVEARALPASTVKECGTVPFRIGMSTPGVLANLGAYEIDRAKPAKGRVEIDVRAVGLNFRDVMAATGLLPLEAEPDPPTEALGLECAGVVAAIGPGVQSPRPGTRVMAPARGAMRTSVVVDARSAIPLPRHIDFAAAATIPTAFMTAYYGLVN